MTAATRMQYTSMRIRIVDDTPLIGIKHTVRDAAGESIKMPWIESDPESMAALAKAIQEAIAELAQMKPDEVKP